MKRSFRLKIALLSFGVSGTLLAAFGIAFFINAYRFGIDRMDREIRALVQAQLNEEHPVEHWQNFDRSLRFIYGNEHAALLAVRVSDPLGTTLFQSENTPPEVSALPTPRFPLMPPLPPGTAMPFPTGKPKYMTLSTADGDWRVGLFCNPEVFVCTAMNMNAFYRDIRHFKTAFFITVPLGLILLAITGWLMASHALKPVAVIADTLESITAKGLDRRIQAVETDSELDRLVRTANRMLDRLEKSYHQAVRFSADAAHELQTPLTILQGELDNALQAAADSSDEQRRCNMLLGELRNLKAVVQKLLLLAHADEGRLALNHQSVDLTDMVRAAAEDLEMLAPHLTISEEIESELILSADPALLTQALRNMITNAAKYTPNNGAVRLELSTDGQTARFTLSNTAPPIPDPDRPLLFERFHRVDKARSASGSGLGLSLAREIARAHDGDLVLNPYTDGRVSFTLQLPA